MIAQPSIQDRALGVVGIAGGLALLSAFVVSIDPDLHGLRLVLYFSGAIAIAIALHRRLGDRAAGWAMVVSGVAIAANVCSIVMVVLAIGRESPFGGDFGLIWFWVALGTWLADAAVGLVAWRHGSALRWAAILLTVGSLLAILGMDRLGLSSAAEITAFGRLGLLGVGLNGLAWVVLGVDIAWRRGPRATPAIGAIPAA